MRAFELFSRREGWRGSDEREISAEAEVVLEESDEGIDISISAAQAEPGQIILSLSPESVLVLWARSENNAANQDAEMPNPRLSLLPLPRSVDPEKAAVEYNNGRVRLQLPHAEKDSHTRSSQ